MENSSHQFSFRNQKEKNTFGTAIAIFSLTNKIKCKHADYLYIYHWKTMSNEPNASYTCVHSFVQLLNVSSQLYIPSLVPDWKTAIWFFAICSKEPFLLPSVKTINRLSSCLQQATTVHNLYHVFKDCHHSKTFQVQMGIQKGSRKEMFWKPQSLVKPVVLIVVLKIYQTATTFQIE